MPKPISPYPLRAPKPRPRQQSQQQYRPPLYYQYPQPPRPRKKEKPPLVWIALGVSLGVVAVVFANLTGLYSQSAPTATATAPVQARTTKDTARSVTPTLATHTATRAAQPAAAFNPADCHDVKTFEDEYNGNYEAVDLQTVCLTGIVADVYTDAEPGQKDMSFSFHQSDPRQTFLIYNGHIQIIDRTIFPAHFLDNLEGKSVEVRTVLHKDYQPGSYYLIISKPDEFKILN